MKTLTDFLFESLFTKKDFPKHNYMNDVIAALCTKDFIRTGAKGEDTVTIDASIQQELKADFDALSKLRKAYFTWNDNPDTTHIGVSAQEVQELYPEVVAETDGQLSVDYAKLSVVALAAVDELHKKNVELEVRRAKLEAMLLK